MQLRGTYGILVTCTLEILDDDFNTIITKSSAGGNDVSFANKKDASGKDLLENGEKVPMSQALALNNDVTKACHEAFKNCCKKLGIGMKSLEEAKKGKVYAVTFKKRASFYEKGMFCDVSVEDSEISRFAVFQRQMDTLKKDYPNGFESGQKIFVYGKEGTDRNGNRQLIFDSVADIAEEPVQQTQTAEQVASDAPEIIKISVKSKTPVTERSNKSGDFSMQVINENNETLNLVIPKNTILGMSKHTWSTFVLNCSKTAEKPVHFTMECTKGMEANRTVYYMIRFASNN